MPIEVFMPALSPTMETGTLASWQVKVGDTVSPGDVIAEIETDKATMEVESIDEGRVAKLLVDEGTEDVPVGQPIAILLAEGEDDSAIEDAGSPSGPAAADTKGSAEPEPADQQPKSGAAAGAPTPQAELSRPGEPATPVSAEDGTTAGPAPVTAEGERIAASPLARRMARQLGLDLTQVQGTGPRGRIVKADIEAARGKAPDVAEAAPQPARPAAAAAPTAAPLYDPPADVPYEEVKLPGMRKVIARRMSESKQTVPHFYLTIDVALDNLMAMRKQLNAKLESDGVKLSVNDFIIKACALALMKVPTANVQYAGDKMYKFGRADISVAVAVPGGLVTPVIRDAQAKGLAQISGEMKDLAAKARDGKLMPEDYQGGTFSLSNLGMFGIREFGAVINPPQGAILAVGQGEKRPVVVEDAVQIKLMMSCTLAVDHRALDGAIGAEWLAAFKGFLEDPVMMLV
ncbi:MAG: pyruvate dehydrogenase complex dihydrolipoamide acetyltransferase [Rhodothalassiaceae bacterium]